ncbi:CrcB protein [Conyzicola lurida]|uniref:Fluoride-specific ion channel FluC n=1 Tax=Conyzicola lurida TaxID=1172621 RepID=A0A841AU25_9MICO|nr:CrcB family protein [Conyzicola lurida]MBB5845085.1 CrcB protein [Conyzicola lurida]
MGWRSLLAVLAGGILGTGLRLGIDTLVTQPLSTLVINVVGAFALGLLVSRVWPTARDWVRAGLGPGLLGSFTTFSAFAVTLVSLGASDEWMTALAYLVATLVLGLAGAWAGLRLGRRGSAVTR